MKLIKNLAVFGTGVIIGSFGVFLVQAIGLVEGDKIYEDDEVYVKSITDAQKGYQMAMIYDKKSYEGNCKFW